MSNLDVSEVEQNAFISVRLVTMDHYMAEPLTSDLDPIYSSLRSYAVKRVPVIRVFGPTSNGQKTCLHIHGILPYMFVPKPEGADDSFLFRLAASLDKALNISMLAGLSKDNNDGGRTSQQQHIYKIVEVRARPFYGYHPREHNFYKIFFYNPWLVKRAADILQNGAVMGRVLQPHFSHIPYTLQFMMDYNLQGMNMIHLRHCLFRRTRNFDNPDSQTESPQSSFSSPFFVDGKRVLDLESTHQSDKYFDIRYHPANKLLLPNSVKRMSISELEIDAVAADIINTNEDLMSQTLLVPEGQSPLSLTPPLMKSRRATKAGKKKRLTNPGLEALWQDERMRRATLLAGLIDKEDAESLSPPDSPPRNRDSDWKSDSQQFWEGRLANVIKQMEEKGMLDDENVNQRDEDPDSTANYFAKVNGKPGSSKSNVISDDPIVYPSEICNDESQFLQEATALDVHVSSLSQSVLGTPESRKSISRMQNKKALEKKTLSFDDSVIDEDILTQTISDSLSQKEEGEDAQYFDEDEIELMDLLNELGKERTLADNAPATKNKQVCAAEGSDDDSKGSVLTPKQILTKKQFEEDVQQTLEMSQVWDLDPAFDNLVKELERSEGWPNQKPTESSKANLLSKEETEGKGCDDGDDSNKDDTILFSQPSAAKTETGFPSDDDDIIFSSQPPAKKELILPSTIKSDEDLIFSSQSPVTVTALNLRSTSKSDDDDLIFSSQPPVLPTVLKLPATSKSDDEDLILSSQPVATAVALPSTSKRFRTTHKQKGSIVKEDTEKVSDWGDDSFWNTIDFENM